MKYQKYLLFSAFADKASAGQVQPVDPADENNAPCIRVNPPESD